MNSGSQLARQEHAKLPVALVADDDPFVRQALGEQLKRRFSLVATAGDADSAISLARRHKPDVALVDVDMPGGGLHATHGIRDGAPDTAVVILTADRGRASVLQFLDAGAMAYLRKDMPFDQLLTQLDEAIVGHGTRTERASDCREAAKDGFRAAFDAAGGAMAIVALAGADAGRLIEVNRAFGLMLGIDAGELVGDNLEKWTHPDDLPDGVHDPLTRLARDDAQQLQFGQRYVHSDGHAVDALGIVASYVDAGSRRVAIIQVLDVSARRRRDGQAERLADRDQRRRSRVDVSRGWRQRLQRAIDNEGFVLLAQPIVPVCSAGPPRFELLLRMPDDNGELIAPGTFLGYAERFGLIQQIDAWVMTQAVRLLHDHQAQGNDISLAINISGKTLNAGTIGGRLQSLLNASPVPAGRLMLELTETAAIANIDRARGLAHYLRELGCRLSLDDFGAGFATFYYLKHLEFDCIKIDGEFIKRLPRTPSDRLIVRAVVDIARGLGAETIAECVQDDETLALLRDLGVDYAQGYHTGRPASLDTILPLRTDIG